MSKLPEQSTTPSQPPDQCKGAFIRGGTFYEQVIGYQENTIHIARTPDPMPLDQAQALLSDLLLDDVPAPRTLPDPHRMPFTPNPLFAGHAEKLREIAAQFKAGGTRDANRAKCARCTHLCTQLRAAGCQGFHR